MKNNTKAKDIDLLVNAKNAYLDSLEEIDKNGQEELSEMMSRVQSEGMSNEFLNEFISNRNDLSDKVFRLFNKFIKSSNLSALLDKYDLYQYSDGISHSVSLLFNIQSNEFNGVIQIINEANEIEDINGGLSMINMLVQEEVLFIKSSIMNIISVILNYADINQQEVREKLNNEYFTWELMNKNEEE